MYSFIIYLVIKRLFRLIIRKKLIIYKGIILVILSNKEIIIKKYNKRKIKINNCIVYFNIQNQLN